MSESVRTLQRGLNHFTSKYLAYVAPLHVDGKLGLATQKRIGQCKFWLGYARPINDTPNAALRSRLWHPKDPRYSSPARIARGMQRRVVQRRKAKRNHRIAHKTTGVGRFDGIPVANVAIPILQWCREHGWHGRLVSGWRDPNYSQHLCEVMCGRPSCPGRCAGLSSNHVGSTPERFAVDVSDYVTFGHVVARCPLKPRIFNNLPIDPVHFSPDGH